MSSRPRRSAAQRATEAITDMADRDNERVMSSRARRSGGIASVSRGPASSPASSPAESGQHIHLHVKLPANKLRQATTAASTSKGTAKRASVPDDDDEEEPTRDTIVHFSKVNESDDGVPISDLFPGSAGVKRQSRQQWAAPRRTRGTKKSYVVESEDDDDDDDDDEEEEDDEDDDEEDEEGEDEIEVGTRSRPVRAVDEEDDDDAEGEVDDDVDMDAVGDDDDDDADADGDIDMDAPPPPAITISKPSRTASKGKALPTSKPPVRKGLAVPKPAVKHQVLEEDDDDDELSELESEPDETAMELGGDEEDAEGEDEEIEDMDAEGEEIEVADEDAEGEDDEELDSDDLGSRAGTPDLSKLTARQRAKIGGASHEYLKLSDEVQAKRVFTAEELSMRRLEMARRRRNLSEKRNEEVKMETINKLLKKQAPKTNRRNALLGDETPDGQPRRADGLYVRYVSTKDGNRIGIPDDMVAGPTGRAIGIGGGLGSGKMVEEVS